MSVNIRQLVTTEADFEAEFQRVLHWSAETDDRIEEVVAAIIADVRKRGDVAVQEYTERFDGLSTDRLSSLELAGGELREALAAITPAQRNALEAAAQRVRSYHERQLDACGRSWNYRDEDGTLLGQKVTPLDRVGIYVPGGKAAYPSSVLMNALPAKVAGVGEIIMVVPTPGGQTNPLVLAAAAIACSRSVARRRWQHSPTARPRCRRSTRSLAPATPTWRARNGVCSARSAST
jgi:histidinol dehydrogenase